MEIKFKYDIGTVVKNKIGGTGVITALYLDKSGIQYYVKTSDGGNYWEEEMISIVASPII